MQNAPERFRRGVIRMLFDHTFRAEMKTPARGLMKNEEMKTLR